MALIRVDALQPGDKLDLENDRFANGPCSHEQITGEPCPDHDENGRSITWQHEYGVVDELVRETPDCIRVDFTNCESIGFPPDHRVQRVPPQGGLMDTENLTDAQYDALAELVHEQASQLASNVVNAGSGDMVDYLLSNGWTIKEINERLGVHQS